MTHKFVTDDQGGLGPLMKAPVDGNVTAANPCIGNLDQNLPGPGSGLGLSCTTS